MANTPNKFNPPNNIAPGYNFVAITTGASVPTGGFRAIFVGTAGDLLITGFDDTIATFTNCQSGSILPIMGKAIGTSASGSTASNLVLIIG